MLFDLFNAQVSFQGYINKILTKKFNIFVIVFLDDILINTEDLSKTHVNIVYQIFKKLGKHALFTQLKKCQFYKDKICFLDYIVLA